MLPSWFSSTTDVIVTVMERARPRIFGYFLRSVYPDVYKQRRVVVLRVPPSDFRRLTAMGLITERVWNSVIIYQGFPQIERIKVLKLDPVAIRRKWSTLVAEFSRRPIRGYLCIGRRDMQVPLL